MPETFFILLAGGVMFASAIPQPRTVTLQWLRLAGLIALTMAGLSMFFWTRREVPRSTEELALQVAILGLIAAHLALVQIAKPAQARPIAMAATLLPIWLAVVLIGTQGNVPVVARALGCAGVAAMSGLVLMEMLLGHAYLTASKMTMAPFRRMNLALAGVLLLRMFIALCSILMEPRWPIDLFWARDGLFIGTRWLVGLLVPAVFIYMTYDCIKRRATQSATGILYVTGVLVFIGELIALHLTRETGLPF